MTKATHYEQLQYDECIAIASSQAQGLSIRAMARILSRAASTISREIARNAPSGQYRCTFAQQRAATAGVSIAARSLNCTSPACCLPRFANS